MQDANDVTEPPASNSNPWAGLEQRTLSAAVIGLAVIFLTLLGGYFYLVFVFAAALAMYREWQGLTETMDNSWKWGGFVYVSLPCAALVALRFTESGITLVFYLLFVVWATDIGAFFAGRTIGGPKLAPGISPGKTWAGLGGGVLAAIFVGIIFYSFAPYPTGIVTAVLVSAILACVAQAGDLFESWMKRRAGVKDSGNLIPGHGGILDRVDGLIFTAPLLAFYYSLFG